jgi:hypothetical protein
MAKKTKDDFLMQAIETAVSMAAQSTERIADLLPADLFAAVQPPVEQPVPAVSEQPYDEEVAFPPDFLAKYKPNELI